MNRSAETHTPEVAMRISGLSVGYGHHIVAADIDAELKSGCVTVLLGANGAGKSTLLRTLSGRSKPLEGLVTIGGVDISGMSRMQMARSVSVVFTARTNAGALTVWQLVALGRQPYTGFWGRLSDSDRRIVDRAIADVGITHLASRYVATLSDGERQKAMIARALTQQTPLMILDEPTSFLDVASRLEVMKLLAELSRRRGVAVLLSTHDVAAALTVASELWLLGRDGRLVCGPVADLVDSGAMDSLFSSQALYFDSQSLDYRLRH